MIPIMALTIMSLMVLNVINVGGTKMPLFSWDTVPVFVHMCNASGPFNDSTMDYLTRFPMVTVEKGQGLNATNEPYASQYAEEKIMDALKRVKQLNSSIITILYLNTVLDWTMYQMHQTMIQHPEWWLKDEHGNVVRIEGDHHFPQPTDGMLVFDHSQQKVQEFWKSACLNWTASAYIDGCFADRAHETHFKPFNLTEAQTDAFSAGEAATLLSVQRALNETNNSVLIANNWYCVAQKVHVHFDKQTQHRSTF